MIIRKIISIKSNFFAKKHTHIQTDKYKPQVWIQGTTKRVTIIQTKFNPKTVPKIQGNTKGVIMIKIQF